MMPPIALSSVLLPEPLGPIRPTVVPEEMARSTSRRAQKSSRCWREIVALTSRSLTDLSLRITNRLDSPSTSMTAGLALISQLLCEVALEPGEDPLAEPQQDEPDPEGDQQ